MAEPGVLAQRDAAGSDAVPPAEDVAVRRRSPMRRAALAATAAAGVWAVAAVLLPLRSQVYGSPEAHPRPPAAGALLPEAGLGVEAGAPLPVAASRRLGAVWKAPSEPCVTVNVDRGRFGNHVYDGLWKLAVAINLGARVWHFKVRNLKIVAGVFNKSLLGHLTRPHKLAPLPDEVANNTPAMCRITGCERQNKLPNTCPLITGVMDSKNCLTTCCKRCIDATQAEFDTPQYAALAAAYLRPLLAEPFAACLAKPYTEAEEKRLTIHLRGEDLWPPSRTRLDESVNGWSWEQPPCQFYAKIIEDGNFSDVQVVTSRDRRNGCVAWLEGYQKREREQGLPLQVSIQSRSLWEDGCVLARARHLVWGFSSFPVAFALLGQRAQRIYSTGRIMSEPARVTCSLWPGVTYVRYIVRIQKYRDRKNTLGAFLNYTNNLSMEDVEGPYFGCSGSTATVGTP